MEEEGLPIDVDQDASRIRPHAEQSSHHRRNGWLARLEL
jgi:hypothetical protein